MECADRRFLPPKPVRAWEVLLALVTGALIASAVMLVAGRLTRGNLEIVPASQTVTARAWRPITVTLRLRNRGRGALHLLGVSGG